MTLAVRTAGPADLDAVAGVLTEAFADDPVWGWAIPEPGAQTVWWRFLAGSALRYPCTWIAGDAHAVAMWIPPGGTELTPDEEQRVEPLLRELVGSRAGQVLELLDGFEANHPTDHPHYYLSLLGTARAHRGQGIGMSLLRENLARLDAEGAAAYLESSNPRNDARYAGVGFRPVGAFGTAGGQRLTTMWRDAGRLPEGRSG